MIPAKTAGPWVLPSQRKVGVICLILTESALFAIFVVAYVYYMGKSLNPPFPRDVIPFPTKTRGSQVSLSSASSFTIVYAEKMMHKLDRKGFLIWWGITMALGAYFVYYSATEWMELIYHEGLTISVNVFGTTFYSLVGLHLSHVIVGLILLGIIFVLTLFGKDSHGSHRAHRDDLLVLAFCRWHLGRRAHSRLLHQRALLTMKHDPSKTQDTVELPTPTAWPIVTAFGLTLFFAAFVTHVVFAVVGVVVGLVGGVGWCLDLFPHPKHEPVPLRPPSEHPEPIRTTGRVVRILEVGKMSHRARIPVEVHPYTAGAFGGIVGAVVMAALACVYGIFKYGSIWYPINLLAAAGVPSLAEASLETLRQFSLSGLIVGSSRSHLHLHPGRPSLRGASPHVAGPLRMALGWDRDSPDLDGTDRCLFERH